MNGGRMRSLLASFARWSRTLLDSSAILLAAAFCLALGLFYFTVRKPHLPWLRPLLPAVAEMVGGYEIEELQLSLRADAKVGVVVADAQLRVHIERNLRGPLAFLLDPGFRVEHLAWVDGSGEEHRVVHEVMGPVVFTSPQAALPTSGTLTVRLQYSGRPLALASSRDAHITDQEILLPPDALWYPTNAHSFFSFSVRAELPQAWELVNASTDVQAYERGLMRVWEWSSERPVSGLGLVAGSYRVFARALPGLQLRVFAKPEDRELAELVLEQAEASEGVLRGILGSSGFPAFSVFLHPSLSRAFFDGSGVIGLPRASLASADQGFGLIAHELAHAWWGGSTSGHWLSAGEGSQWITESFAEVSSLLASEQHSGSDARVRRMVGECFDPAYHEAVADMTVLDNALGAPGARETIYRKGSFLAWMLRSAIGPEPFAQALRALTERYRYRAISDREVRQVFEEVSGQSLDWFFSGFLRGQQAFDLHADAADGGAVEAALLGGTKVPAKIRVWERASPSEAWKEQTVELPHRFDVAAGSGELVLDPLLEWPDVQRENNRFPRQAVPVFVSAGPDQWLVARGEPFPWSRQHVELRGEEDRPRAQWVFERGLVEPPLFDPKHGWFAAAISEPGPVAPLLVVLETDGTRRAIGRGFSPAVGADGAVFAAVRDRIVRIGPSGRARTLVHYPGAAVQQIAASGDGKRLAYVVRTSSAAVVYTLSLERGEAAPVFHWERAPVRVRWIGDEDVLLVAAVDGRFWQLSEVPVSGGPLTPVASNVVALADFAPSPDGALIALAAQPAPDFPRGRRSLYILDRAQRSARTVSSPDDDFLSLAWQSPTALFAVAESVPAMEPLSYPRPRTLYRLSLPEARLEKIPLGNH